MNIAIIGAGFSGLAAAWHALKLFPKARITLFDSLEIGKGTSGIAAGLLHPYSGAHAKLNWRGKEGVEATNELLTIAEKALKKPVTAKTQGILRLALREEQLSDFKLCAEKHPEEVEWLSSSMCQEKNPGCAEAPGIWIKNGVTVYSALYLQGLWLACQEEGVTFKQQAIHSLKELDHFDITIAATGAGSLSLPETASLPLHLVKGQILELSWPEELQPLNYPLNSRAYLLMTPSNASCLVGATFEKGFAQADVDLETAKAELLPKVNELFPPLKDATVINCQSGMRVAAPQHRPLIKRLSSKQWIFTGLGSKGLLYHALFARELIQSIKDELHPLLKIII